MKKCFITVLFISILALALNGLTSAAAAENLAKKQVLTIAFDAGDGKSLDPHRAATTVDRSTVDPIFNGLVRYPPGSQIKPEPDLAESWSVSEDKKVWTFKLRKGIFFHPSPGQSDGYELTSEDVVYSLMRAADSKHSAYAGEYNGIGFSAPDANTVVISLENPISATLFLAKFAAYAGGYIVPKKVMEAKGDDWFKINPVGTGPFMFKSYIPREKTVLVRNPKYFRGAPILEQVVIRYMPSVSSRELGLRTGELDVIEGQNEEKWVDQISRLPEVKVVPFGPCETQMVHLNMTKKPFDSLKVRQAVAYAISRGQVAAFMGSSLAVPIYSAAMAPPAAGAVTNEEAEKAGVLFDNNIDKAKALLAEAGLPDGFKAEVIISELATSYRKPMIGIQAQLKKAGIDIALKVVDHSSFHSLIRDDASPMVLYACWRPNSDVFLTRFYHSDSVVVSGSKPDTNFSHYGTVDADGDGKVDSIDDLIEKARLELDADKQSAMWREAQIQLLNHAAVVPIIRLKYVFPMKSYVELGHPLEFSWSTYSPQITEKTRILAH